MKGHGPAAGDMCEDCEEHAKPEHCEDCEGH